MPERMTAKKVRIADIANGDWVKQDGMEPSYVIAKTGERVSRARILATVASKFMSEDGNFGSVTVDDGTDTIRAKCFKDMGLLERVEKGHLIDLIGKVREYNGEVYVIPEVMKQVSDPNLLSLRKLEIAKKLKDLKEGKAEDETEGKTQAAPEAKATEKDETRKKVLGLIEASKDGIEYAALIEKSKQPEEKVESVVNDLLSEGICYEPTPGKIKKI